ncbi:MAG: polyprenyl synthetase family protein [Bacteriovorax sp.]|nr:polyprenyl synthetase family protein [Bacteriovorax sp.]
MLTDFLDSIPSHVLDRSKNLDLRVRSVNAHSAIDEVLSRTVLRGGKRLRPLLTYLVANLLKIDLERITPFARASELVHAASLSHDDVIDNATVRRGSPSINILYSNKKAVLAGDYLLSSVIVDLCSTGELSLVNEMSLVIKDLSEGEWLQLDLISSREYTRELIREIALKKTSSVMSYCTLAPAILAKMPQEVQDICRSFGISLGLAFQLIDDTLDYSGNSLKDQELDLKNGIVNAVVFELFSVRPDLMKRFKNGEDLTGLLITEDMNPSVKLISNEALNQLENARLALSELGSHLGTTLYKNQPKELELALEHLQLVVSYMALRQS